MVIFRDFYVQPMNAVYIEAVVIYLIWTLAMLFLRGRAQKTAGIIGALMSIALIFVMTLYGRNSDNTHIVNLIPFSTFVNAKIQPELYRSMFMNVLLFMPFGLSFPFAFQDRIKHRLLVTIALGFLLSVGVEAVQFFFNLGRCETDDVFMNTLGVMIGTTSYLLCRLIKNPNKKTKS